ncbi:KefB related efflux transport protein [Leptospira ryugenii]|uniref:KefB related efflux transport protein n=1 Tax=Leptospira ryugenii TaxID=1917863 RepID=A0A2P2DVQ9_9LEPT|nr:monovalent cation:proton antiporter-2 (CPA2) family protein [Leptospira ryugenii]GBF48716.1 KefB related efflux transport protein [Leptospira ryugenii]
MENLSFFFQAMVYLGAAIVMVPIAHRLGLGSVLGYLLAGILIGPSFFGWVGEEGEHLLHFAEFGVVMMLFVIGLELEIDLLLKLKNWLIGLGGLQVLVTTLFFTGISYLFTNHWKASLAIGMILSLSSTAIVLQTLKEKGLMKAVSGQASFSVLLFQDMAVIPMLAIFPFLIPHDQVLGDSHSSSLIAHLPAWLRTVLISACILSIVFLGKFALNPLFRVIAKTGLREIFTAASLLLVIGISLLMTSIGLSQALGTFLAGVVLASSEFRHELESDIEPFKGLLLGLFFISVGSSMEVALVLSSPGKILLVVAMMMIGKTIILFVLGKLFSFPKDQNLYFSLALSQVGEFAFVLFSFSEQNGILDKNTVSLLVAAVAISMAMTPIFLLLYEKLYLPKLATNSQSSRKQDHIENEENPVIIAGFGKFGNMLGRFLRGSGIHLTVLDYDADRVEMLRKFDFKVYFGDATRYELLLGAGAEKAKLMICALDSYEKQVELIHTVKKHFPNLKILARAGDREEAYELKSLGADSVFRETRETAVEMGIEALKSLGFRSYQAKKAALTFLDHDTQTFEELYKHRNDRKTYISLAKQRTAELERLMKVDTVKDISENSDIWGILADDELPVS